MSQEDQPLRSKDEICEFCNARYAFHDLLKEADLFMRYTDERVRSGDITEGERDDMRVAPLRKALVSLKTELEKISD